MHLHKIALLTAVLLAVYGCDQKESHTQAGAEKQAEGGNDGGGSPEFNPNWNYTDSVTGLGEHLRLACIQSTNTAKLEWPYGEVRGKLCLRNLDGKLGFAIMTTGDSQMLCDQIEGNMCLVPVRCNDQEPDRWPMREPSDHSTKMVVSSGDGIPLCMTAAKRIVVAPTFYQGGRQDFEFESAGFDLKKLGISGNRLMP